MQHWLNRPINFYWKVLTVQGMREKKGCSCHFQKTFRSFPAKLFQFSSPWFIGSQTNLFTFHWFFVCHHLSKHVTTDIFGVSKTRMSFVSIEFLCQISSLNFTQITPHWNTCHRGNRETRTENWELRRKEKTLFLVRIRSRWRNLWNDLWDLLQLIIKVSV